MQKSDFSESVWACKPFLSLILVQQSIQLLKASFI